MLVEKEVIGPGTVWYNDLKSGEPRKAVVTKDHTQHWCEQGNKMLALGLTVPIPCEHDFGAHPMTPAEQLKNNAGWVKEYKLKGDRLFSILDIQDEELAKKLPTTVRWTSPWFSSFVDGKGRTWNNVIAHLALTTRPRVTQQAPFPSIAAAMEFVKTAKELVLDFTEPGEGFALSRAGLLKVDGDKLIPEYPIAFSLYSGVALSEDDMEDDDDEDDEDDAGGKRNSLSDSDDDMKMEKLLCDLLSILGVPMPETVTKSEFKRVLYKAAMLKIKELSDKPPVQVQAPAAAGAPPSGRKPPHNPIVQEPQPMYMSLEEINKIPDETMRNIALSMYNENVKLQAALDKTVKDTASLRDAKLAEETAKRKLRIDRLSRLSPKVKADLDAMLALPSMALSMGDSGAVVDPMSQTLTILEKGLSDLPQLLQTETSALSVQPQPTDGEMSQDAIDQTADSLARMMGCAPEQQKKAG